MSDIELIECADGTAIWERFEGERPPEPFTMRVLRDEWTEREGLLLRTVLDYELVETRRIHLSPSPPRR